jgi:hypothetical protein
MARAGDPRGAMRSPHPLAALPLRRARVSNHRGTKAERGHKGTRGSSGRDVARARDAGKVEPGFGERREEWVPPHFFCTGKPCEATGTHVYTWVEPQRREGRKGRARRGHEWRVRRGPGGGRGGWQSVASCQWPVASCGRSRGPLWPLGGARRRAVNCARIVERQVPGEGGYIAIIPMRVSVAAASGHRPVGGGL